MRSPCDRRLPEARGERLFYGDNLDVLRKHFDDETVDLVYLDPPFNSSTDYSLTTRSSTGFVERQAARRTDERRGLSIGTLRIEDAAARHSGSVRPRAVHT